MAFPSQSFATALPSSTFQSAVIAFRAPMEDFYADCDATATDIRDLEEYLLPTGGTAYSIIRASVPDDADADPNAGGGAGGAGGAGGGAGEGDDDDDDDGAEDALNNLPDLPPDDGDPDDGDAGDGDDGEEDD